MIPMLLWFVLLHHIPGVCAPGEDEHSSDGRVRRHLLGTAVNVVVDARERMVAALERETDNRADLLAWALREAIGAAPSAATRLWVNLEEIRETAKRETQGYRALMNLRPQSWTKRATSALVLVLAVAVGSRVAWELLAPLVPTALVLLGLLGLYGFFIGRR